MPSVTKRCLFCQKEISIVIDRRIDPLKEKLLREKEAMCQDCARERRLDPGDTYFVFAGSMYQKLANVHLKLWPVGAFH